jgi:hypothetical protein
MTQPLTTKPKLNQSSEVLQDTEIDYENTDFLDEPGQKLSSDLFSLNTEVVINDTPDKKSVTRNQVDDVVEDISRNYNTTKTLAYIGLCATLQAGGANKNKRSNVKITINQTTFESKKVNEIINRYCKNITPRQFARIFCIDIFRIAVRFNIVGNAYISLKRYYPHLLLETNIHEKYWASDFQGENSMKLKSRHYCTRDRSRT